MTTRIQLTTTPTRIEVFVHGFLDQRAISQFYETLVAIESSEEERLISNIELRLQLAGLAKLDDCGIGMLLLVVMVSGTKRAVVHGASEEVVSLLSPFPCFLVA